MKYVILIYRPRTTECGGLVAELTESGELIDHVPLADPVNTRTIRISDDTVVATDGPLRAGEDLAGYFVVDCDGLERATEIAARLPCDAVEVRPVMELSGMEM